MTVCAAMGHASESDTPAPQEEEIVFIPPASGAPADRLGAGTRQVDPSKATTVLLAPTVGGISASAKPLLIWYFTQTVEGPITVAIIPKGGLARGFATTINGPFPKGFHGLNLRRSQAELSPGRLYHWEVRDGRSGVASPQALIEHRPADAPVLSAREAAAAGLWYDALALLFEAAFSGQLKLKNQDGLISLSQSAGLDLTKTLDTQE